MGLKNILGAFIEISEDKKQEIKKDTLPSKASGKTETPSQPVQTFTPSFTSSMPPGSITEFDAYFANLLTEENQKNFPGTDYYEFVTAKENMNAIPVEETKYVTTFNVLKSTGLTKDVLLSTAKRYMDVITNELTTFVNSYQSLYKQQVEDKQALIDEKAKQMQTLSEQINALNQEMTFIQTEMTQNKIKLTSKKEGFQIAAENKKKQIQDEVDKITRYIQ